jgi:hypothetical protein
VKNSANFACTEFLEVRHAGLTGSLIVSVRGVEYSYRTEATQRWPLTPRQNRPLLLLAVVAVLAASAALALLLTSVPPGNDSAEAGFARDMVVHHAQAV